MSKSYVLFSLALGGLVLAGCNKDENPSPVAPGTSGPSSLPTSMPTTGDIKAAADSATTTVGAAADSAKTSIGNAVDSAKATIGSAVDKAKATTIPSTDSK